LSLNALRVTAVNSVGDFLLFLSKVSSILSLRSIYFL
jgi:hypothetical protein